MNTPAARGHRDTGKQQALRLRRLVLGGVSYLFTLVLVVIYWRLGYFAAPVLVNYVAAVVALNIAFFVAIKTNINLRLADPSMTLLQVCLSIMPGLYVMYHAQQSRGVFLLLCVAAAMYGLFQFRLRDFFMMTLCVVGSYAGLIALVYFRRPGEIDLQIEILQLIALLATFLQFSGLGTYIGGLRDKVKDKNKLLELRNVELERALARIEELAMRDELTGVFNRRYLMETIRNEKSRCDRTGS
ncbi:MAG: GGDEF domain-containing protein, partial [Telluria sp.]